MQYEQVLKNNFPDLQVVGENYPPSNLLMQLHNVATVVKFITIGTIIVGPNTFGIFGRNPPAWFLWTQENKFASIFLTWVMAGQIESWLLSTGAFEVYFNDINIHSALETGRPPSIEHISGIINDRIVPNSIESDLLFTPVPRQSQR